MPWWAWLLAALGVGVFLALAWLALYVYLMSRGD